MILRGQVGFLARSQSPTAYRRSPLYTRGPLLYTHKLAATRGGPMASIGPYRMGSRVYLAPEGSMWEEGKIR